MITTHITQRTVKKEAPRLHLTPACAKALAGRSDGQARFGFTSSSEERRASVGLHGVRAMTKQARFGFTLVETLVAISILLLALVGPMSIASRGLSAAYNARDEVIAYYLAQEGIEYVRAVRDQNYLTSVPWLTTIDACLNTPCVVDMPNFSRTVCPLGGCPALLVAAGSGLYNQASGVASPYTRTLTIVPVVGNPDEVVVTVKLSWVSGRISRTFELIDHLFRSQ